MLVITLRPPLSRRVRSVLTVGCPRDDSSQGLEFKAVSSEYVFLSGLISQF